MTSAEGSRLVRFASVHRVLQVLVVAGLMLRCSSALRLLKVKAPPTVLYGGVAKLDCQYDLESDSLYAAKWFKDGYEFYRYRPGVGVTTFPVQGVTVNNSESIGATVYLHNLTLQSSGLYNCEISAESPSFQTVIGVKQINVIALPRHGPRIEGARRRYRAAETVNLNCTSGKSKPAPVLRWFINGALVTDSKSQSDITTVRHSDGFETVSRRLQFVGDGRPLRSERGHQSEMRSKCSQCVRDERRKSATGKTAGRPRRRKRRGRRLSVQGPFLHHTTLDERIRGGGLTKTGL
ncbi:uncharacterized protein LOC119382744 [Rhipicephalus sanguineus]|uniref:uncharacterized protein LOC119382744 n=1 Tax=Rhipicephalus sanguineus TaxID=34632 RepID=UPI001893AE42|nr:uncharacterized protein LOC119382744 [Rhipicephalus sanguineus]